MKLNKLFIPVLMVSAAVVFSGCKEGNSVYDPGYEPARPNPVITSISPAGSYLAGVDSVIVTGENFGPHVDSMTINFGGSPGIIKSLNGNQMVVRPGTKSGENLDVRMSVRGAEFFSDVYEYTLEDPFNIYFGLTASDEPISAIAVDGNDNIYTIIDRGGVIRYTRISPDGNVEKDLVKYPGEPRPDPSDTRPFPTDSTMRFTQYSSMTATNSGQLFLTQQGIRAIFTKQFGSDRREDVWGASRNTALKIQDMLFDNNGYLWIVGTGSNEVHRFDVASKSETRFPLNGEHRAVALYNNSLYVAGNFGGVQQIWKLDIDGGGNLGSGELFFDYGQNYNGTIRSMIFAESGELLIVTDLEESIIRLFPDGKHQPLYPGMLNPGGYDITWRSDKYAVVSLRGDNSGLYFLNMYDRERAGIYGF